MPVLCRRMAAFKRGGRACAGAGDWRRDRSGGKTRRQISGSMSTRDILSASMRSAFTILCDRPLPSWMWLASDIDLLGDCERIVDLDPEVTHCALKLGMAQQQLNCPQITGATINQRYLGSAQRVRSIGFGIETDTRHPARNQSCVLTGRYRSGRAAAAGEEELIITLRG